MYDTIRDSVLGQLIRLVTKNKVLLYEEERNPEIWQKYVHREKSANMAQYGQTELPEEDSEKQEDGPDTPARRDSSPNSAGSISTSTAVGNDDLHKGKPVDQEKGKDVYVVDWYGPDDPDVSCSSSSRRGLWLMWYRTLETGVAPRGSGPPS